MSRSTCVSRIIQLQQTFREYQPLLLPIAHCSYLHSPTFFGAGERGRIVSPRCYEPDNVPKDVSYLRRIVLQTFSEHLIYQASKNGSQIVGFYVFILELIQDLHLYPLIFKTTINYLPITQCKIVLQIFFNKSAICQIRS